MKIWDSVYISSEDQPIPNIPHQHSPSQHHGHTHCSPEHSEPLRIPPIVHQPNFQIQIQAEIQQIDPVFALICPLEGFKKEQPVTIYFKLFRQTCLVGLFTYTLSLSQHLLLSLSLSLSWGWWVQHFLARRTIQFTQCNSMCNKVQKHFP